MLKKKVGERTGKKHGALLIILAQVHGNEPAGTRAIKTFFELLETEYSKNKDFDIVGKVMGVCGNLTAAQEGKRFIDFDMNRGFYDDVYERLKQKPVETYLVEEKEIIETLDIIHATIQSYAPTELVVLDLHTTTAKGGIFSIPATHGKSQKIALSLHAPVIEGLLEGLSNTSLHYFNEKNMHTPTSVIAFEAGQHEEETSHQNSVSAIINCMRTIGILDSKDVETKHDELLRKESEGLPRLTKLIYKHSIRPDDDFVMQPGYKNFQSIRKGELLATDKNGEIRSLYDGMILMPLYQKQGSEGFFILENMFVEG